MKDKILYILWIDVLDNFIVSLYKIESQLIFSTIIIFIENQRMLYGLVKTAV
jgi:hypothetical protein